MSETSNELRFEASVASTPATRCGLCLDDMNEEDLWICPDCQTPIHKVCHDEFLSCITLGCPGQRKTVVALDVVENDMTMRHVGLWATPWRFLYRSFTATLGTMFVFMIIACIFGGVVIPCLQLFEKYGRFPVDSLQWFVPSTIFYLWVGGYFGLKALRLVSASLRDLKEIVRIWRL